MVPQSLPPTRGARYRVQRITPGSAVRVGLALGWLIMLCPALGLAWLAARIVARISEQIVAVQPITISLLGQNLAQIDVLQTIGLGTTAAQVVSLGQRLPFIFLVVLLGVVLLGSLAFVVAALLFSLGYNLLARIGGGIEVELQAMRTEG